MAIMYSVYSTQPPPYFYYVPIIFGYLVLNSIRQAMINKISAETDVISQHAHVVQKWGKANN